MSLRDTTRPQRGMDSPSGRRSGVVGTQNAPRMAITRPESPTTKDHHHDECHDLGDGEGPGDSCERCTWADYCPTNADDHGGSQGERDGPAAARGDEKQHVEQRTQRHSAPSCYHPDKLWRQRDLRTKNEADETGSYSCTKQTTKRRRNNDCDGKTRQPSNRRPASALIRRVSDPVTPRARSPGCSGRETGRAQRTARSLRPGAPPKE
jgi:hypothetical protein